MVKVNGVEPKGGKDPKGPKKPGGPKPCPKLGRKMAFDVPVRLTTSAQAGCARTITLASLKGK